MNTIDSIEDRALRQLDGMKVNREAFAHDVIQLCNAARRMQSELAKVSPPTSDDQADAPDGFDFFRSIFK